MNQHHTVYWITGASSGIGEALAKRLGIAGNALIISGRDVKALENLKSESPQNVPVEILPFELVDIDFNLGLDLAEDVFESLPKNDRNFLSGR